MIEKEKCIVLLDCFDFLTYKRKEKLLKHFDNIEKLLDYSFLMQNKVWLLENVIDEEEFEVLSQNLNQKSFELIEKNFEKLNIFVITIFSSDYPEKLKNIDTPPFVLYCRGNKSLLLEKSISIVGTRHITNYGKLVTEKFAKALSDVGFVIVSGLACGVDTIAHTTTIENNGKTIAVLAGGLHEIYPKSNTVLAKQIVEKQGLIISETRPYKKTESYMFPIRNRIISALSEGVLITEAQEKSGVIHTKNYALEYGKDVFAIPGNIFSLYSLGTNRMISNGQAKAVLTPEDILEEYQISINKIKKEKSNYTPEENNIIDILKTGEKTFQELVFATKYEVKTLNSLLTSLVIRGIIKKLAGNVYFLI